MLEITKPEKALQKVRSFAGLVRLSHALFAMPFALVSYLVTLHGLGSGTRASLPWLNLSWVICAIFFARNAAMTFNRLVDVKWDALNPRTEKRHLVTGELRGMEVRFFFVLNAAAFLFCASRLNPLCFYLALPTLALLLFYSVTKRFTWLSHFVLGLALAISPWGAALALEGHLSWTPLPLFMAVLLWVAGFDIIYATLDEEIDRKHALHSFVVAFGRVRALRAARIFHMMVPAFLLLYGFVSQAVHGVYYLACAVIWLLLIYEHTLVKGERASADEMVRVNTAFFRVNAVISATFFAGTVADLYGVHWQILPFLRS